MQHATASFRLWMDEWNTFLKIILKFGILVNISFEEIENYEINIITSSEVQHYYFSLFYHIYA